ncbi:MAG: peptidylprolyl isomerase [Eubacteriales bacterium]|nr:peptidylprolyl isomerase [Eubacteriales bacterium]
MERRDGSGNAWVPELVDPGKKTYDTASLLQEVNRAIAAIMIGGQSYKIGTRSLTRANLTELRNLKADLTAQLDAEAGGPLLRNTSVAFFDRR